MFCSTLYLFLRVSQLKVFRGEDCFDTRTGLVSVRFPCTTRSEDRAELDHHTWVPLEVGRGSLAVDVDILLSLQQLHWRPEVVTLLPRPGFAPEVCIEGLRLFR